MIPVRLQLKNFLSYRENVPALDFEGIHLACLCGDNGHGKSALLDAITWALWGKARASDDELIHSGKSEMEVEFEFRLGEDRYRVLRKRTRTAKVRGHSTLELQVASSALLPDQKGSGTSNGSYRPIGGNSINETQRKINELLRVDYDTFVNSSFILQGKADSFTLKTPGERKRILGEILSLGDYDTLEEMAREEAKLAENNRRSLEARIEEIEQELSRRPQYQQQLEVIQRELVALGNKLGDVQARRDQLRGRKVELEQKAEELKRLEARLAEDRRQLQGVEAQMEDHRRRIAEYEALLVDRAATEGEYYRFLESKRQDEELNSKLSILLRLNEQKAKLERSLDQARNELNRQASVARSQLDDLERKSSLKGELERRLGTIKSELEPLRELVAVKEKTMVEVQSIQTQMATIRTDNERLQEQTKLLGEKLELLSGGAINRCPVCQTELGQEGVERLRRHYDSERSGLQQARVANSHKLNGLKEALTTAQKRLSEIEVSERRRAELEKRVAVLEGQLSEAEEALKKSSGLALSLKAFSYRLSQGDYGYEEREQLHAVQQEMAELAYDQAGHQKLKEELRELAAIEEKNKKLDLAEARIGAEREALAQAEKSLASWQGVVEREEEQRQSLQQELALLPSLQSQLAGVEAELDRFNQQRNQALRSQGEVQQMLKFCESLEKEGGTKQRELEKAKQEKSIYDELIRAFGKNGIQAMIIETVIPEIQEEANRLLARMTDNRMHVKLETQREYKSKEGVVETLDIKISDELGTRNYELYSGGEAFRVNFALRIALSKLLARRAGARLQTLVIDEGFGSQDSQGQDRLVEAINSIKDDFAKILVITHIEELKDQFPVRIEVTKTAEGSQWAIE